MACQNVCKQGRDDIIIDTIYDIIPSEARQYPRSIDIFRRRQPEVGLKTSISQEWCTGSVTK